MSKMFYCPNCKVLETKEISYTEKEYIFTNCRDGYGSFIHNVICKTCNYPLAGVVFIRGEDEESTEYFKSVITAYQDGQFAEKDDMLKAIEKRYVEVQKRYQAMIDEALQIISYCKEFKEKGENT